MRHLRRRLGLTLTLLMPMTVGAQAAAPPCRYDACALRVERQWLRRGAPPGQAAGRFSFWGAPRLAPLVAGSDSAVALAREFDRDYTPGVRLATVGGVIGGVVLAIAFHERNRTASASEWQLLVAANVALTVGLYGQWRANRALGALSRALWWYNRDLPR